MAIYRPVYTSFWQDDFILSIPFAERYFYIYLMTNTKTSLCGIYELPRSIASIETGLSIDKIKDLLNKFQNKYHRVVCSEKTNEIVITNWLKYNNNISPHFQEALTKSFKEVKDTELIRYVYGIEKTRYGMYTVGLQPVSVSDTVINTNTIINGTFKDNDLNTELNTKNTDKQEENLQVSKLDKKSIIEKWNEIDEIAHIDCIEHKRLEHVKAR
ncbi:MAG: hypothetical protein M0R51_16370, partial [Clostridia bacterium]|nr:hypothetical protein [Clostridia bacterium]